MSTFRPAPEISLTSGVRLIRSQLVAQPIVNADGGARIVRVIGGREENGAPSGMRVLRRQVCSRSTRAGIRIIGRDERSVPRAGIRVIGGKDAR